MLKLRSALTLILTLTSTLTSLGVTGVRNAHATPQRAKKASAAKPWLTLPVPPELPTPATSGDVPSAGSLIHFAEFGQGHPVVLLHGGMGNADQMSLQVAALATTYRVIVIDSRGQGRSAPTAQGIHYTQMADDVIAVLDQLKIDQAAFVGWSDGGVIALQLGLRHRARVAGLWLLATNYNVAGMQPSGDSPVFAAYWQACAARWAHFGVSKTDAAAVRKALRVMWQAEPTIPEKALRSIDVPSRVVLGDHDEILRRAHVEHLAALLPKASFVLLRDVSHFALWQDPDAVNRSIAELLTEIWPPTP